MTRSHGDLRRTFTCATADDERIKGRSDSLASSSPANNALNENAQRNLASIGVAFVLALAPPPASAQGNPPPAPRRPPPSQGRELAPGRARPGRGTEIPSTDRARERARNTRATCARPSAINLTRGRCASSRSEAELRRQRVRPALSHEAGSTLGLRCLSSAPPKRFLRIDAQDAKFDLGLDIEEVDVFGPEPLEQPD